MQSDYSVGKISFEYYLQKLENVFQASIQSENPGDYLYRHDARTFLFMLEAICRAYRFCGDKKLFQKLEQKIKEAEDAIGAYDYYSSFYKEFSATEKISKSVIAYTKAKAEIKNKKLNQLMLKKYWKVDESGQLIKLRNKIADAEWLYGMVEKTALQNFYFENIELYTKKVDTNEIDFNNIEEDVHELRRNIRWLSIYAQAFRGLFCLKEETIAPDWISEYVTEEIAQSSFNQLPTDENVTDKIELNKQHFLALSKLIQELGIIKDKGLKRLLITEAEKNMNAVTYIEALKKTTEQLSYDYPSIAALLKEAKSYSRLFFERKVLENLIAD